MKKFSLRRLYFKVMQQEGTPESVGRGIAIGLFIGFILPIGTQTFPALFLAFSFQGKQSSHLAVHLRFQSGIDLYSVSDPVLYGQSSDHAPDELCGSER